MFSTKLVKTPVPTTAPRSEGESARTMVSPAATPIRTVVMATRLFENRFISSPEALLFDHGGCCGRDVESLLDPPAVGSLGIEIFVMTAVVAEVRESTHALG